MPMMQPTGEKAETTNVLIVGVGGQGVVLISKMLARMCQLQGFQVKQSEVHGMAKRGGVVFSHVRFGRQVWSPTIPRGQADILVALEWAEGLRWLPFLRQGSGTFITDTKQIVPPFAYRDRQRGGLPGYADTNLEGLVELVPNSFAVDATGFAQELGDARAANTVLLGILSTSLAFPLDAWQPVLKEFAPRGTGELNTRAFAAGRGWVAGAEGNSSSNGGSPTGGGRIADDHTAFGSPPSFAAMETGPVTFEINEEWCKACDICVKMCPERCLVLNETGAVSLTDPAACTGCRICEMLCPDFAIHITA